MTSKKEICYVGCLPVISAFERCSELKVQTQKNIQFGAKSGSIEP